MSELPVQEKSTVAAAPNTASTLNPFTSASLAMQVKPPAHVARMATLLICGMTTVALLFACMAQMDIVVSAQGKVIPSGKSKVIQPLEPGLVRAIHVRDGQSVKAGDVLLELDPTNAGADQERLKYDSWETQADVLRLKAQIEGRSSFEAPRGMPQATVLNQQAMLQSRVAEQGAKLASTEADVARRQANLQAAISTVDELKSSLPLMRQRHDMREELAKTGHFSKTSLIDSKLELSKAEKEFAVQSENLREAQSNYQVALAQRNQALAEYRARVGAELVEATRKRDAAKQEFVKANQRLNMQSLRAPIDGVVQQLAVTTVGGVVTAAQPLLTVVPENTPLEVEAQILNRDIGHLHVGQSVINKVETYDFTRYGYIEGEVQWVGTDAVQDQKLGLVYPVRIKLLQMQTPNEVNGNKGVVTAGMNITSDIRTDSRRLIEYLIAPMLR